MSITRAQAEEIVREYTGASHILSPLGDGVDGFVYPTAKGTAVKIFNHPIHFEREKAAYERLQEFDVRQVCGFVVPEMRNSSESLRVIEMTIVQPPFLIDFASALLDEEGEYFSEEVMDQKWADLAEIFEDRISIVQDVYFELSVKYGIYYYDFTLNNLRFA
jgi:hypothetical protein